MGFGKIDSLTLNILDFGSFCELIVPFLIFWSSNGKDYEKMVFGGFSRFLAVFWAQK